MAVKRGWEVNEEYELVACREGIGVDSRSCLAWLEGKSGNGGTGGSVARMADDEKIFASEVVDDVAGNNAEFSVGIPMGAPRDWVRGESMGGYEDTKEGNETAPKLKAGGGFDVKNGEGAIGMEAGISGTPAKPMLLDAFWGIYEGTDEAEKLGAAAKPGNSIGFMLEDNGIEAGKAGLMCAASMAGKPGNPGIGIMDGAIIERGLSMKGVDIIGICGGVKSGVVKLLL